ncbi:SDR family NAD(P)-dependent oxidoreductase [Kribbella antibiotica]|uniref:SDR family NAD(P)-dependent oxidoreductase n=1 Tax=Kribbella antibiotica TaxID=190195 RepID=A0A4R4ZMF7_9ACTN|nr:SDR family NAD(P)-dependent oxidoreductase [Kribbella antibiotica]TDD59094.1 SDR family NAD(P)-dependent oxidoreductase [Kribbella antibiotica]
MSLPDLTGRTYAVTGGNAGIGYFISEQLTAAGADVVILARNAERAQAAAAAIRGQVGREVAALVPLDLADLDSVAAAADQLTGLDRLDGLIHNAGVNAGMERRTTRHGFEVAFGTNHLGHFALTALTMPILAATPGSRVVPVGSIMTKAVKFDPEDLQVERSAYSQQKAYTQSKHAVLIFAAELDRRLRAAGVNVRSVAAHPGLSIDAFSPARPGINQAARIRLAVPIQGKDRGARPALAAATDPKARGGQYYGPRYGAFGPPVIVKPPRTTADPATLWAQSEELTGIPFTLQAGHP